MENYRKIIIAGGTGFLGELLQGFFREKGCTVKVLSRQAGEHHLVWNAKTLGAWQEELDGADALINLAGKSVNCRYTKRNKQIIVSSRTDTTALLGEAIARCEKPPRIWLNASTATIYRDTRGDAPANTEAEGEIGDDFSMNVAKSWEKVFFEANTPQTKKAAMRIAIAYGMGGGAFPVVLSLAKKGLCSAQAGGQQWVSWVHELDFCRAVAFILEKEMQGAVNICAPNPLRNQALYRELRRVIQPLFCLPQPKWMLQFGALIMGTETELILKSRKVYPQRLLKEGFEFSFPKLPEALDDLLREKKSA